MSEAREIILTNGRLAIVDASDFEWLSQWKWHHLRVCTCEYAVRREAEKSILMHRAILGCAADEECDHRDAWGLNNRRANLRRCTHQENMRNQRKRAGCTSRYKGVSWAPQSRKWQAYIKGGGKQKSLGFFASEIDAARAYNAAASEMFGEFARLNDV